MSIPRHITEFLDSRGARYKHCTHSPAYTAQEVAHAQHISGKSMAKAVMVIADGRLNMVVLPADRRLDFEKFERIVEADRVRLAQEEEFKDIFPGCELGAMPPLGNLYHIPVWVDVSLKEAPIIHFNAGSHTDTIEMRYDEFENIVKPRLARLAEAPVETASERG